MKNFKKFIPGTTDKEAQEKFQISELEKFILKPHTDGVNSMTQGELEAYIKLDIEDLKTTQLSEKIIIIAERTKNFLTEHKEQIEEEIKKREEENRNTSIEEETER